MPSSTPTEASDEDIRRWWQGGEPAADEPGDDPVPVAPAKAPEPVAAVATSRRREREGWFAAGGGAAAALLLAAFYGVVDDAATQGPARWQAQATVQAEPLQADAGAADVERVNAVYAMPPVAQAPRYARWP